MAEVCAGLLEWKDNSHDPGPGTVGGTAHAGGNGAKSGGWVSCRGSVMVARRLGLRAALTGHLGDLDFADAAELQVIFTPGRCCTVLPMADKSFQVICEVEPPTRPDLMHVRHQIATLSKAADCFLIPDNHLGRATVSSVAVAHEVQVMGGRSIACLNSRDRNLLGFRRDLLTAAAYGVDQFLFVYGDKPTSGGRTSELTVRAMIEEVRQLDTDPAFTDVAPFSIGAAASLGPLPAWKTEADFLFSQVSFSLLDLLRWRDANPVDLPVFAGVMVLASEAQAQRLAAAVPDIRPSAALIDQVRADRLAGVEAACELVIQIRESGAFAGVHLVPVGRYREIAARLEQLKR